MASFVCSHLAFSPPRIYPRFSTLLLDSRSPTTSSLQLFLRPKHREKDKNRAFLPMAAAKDVDPRIPAISSAIRVVPDFPKPGFPIPPHFRLSPFFMIQRFVVRSRPSCVVRFRSRRFFSFLRTRSVVFDLFCGCRDYVSGHYNSTSRSQGLQERDRFVCWKIPGEEHLGRCRYKLLILSVEIISFFFFNVVLSIERLWLYLCLYV